MSEDCSSLVYAGRDVLSALGPSIQPLTLFPVEFKKGMEPSRPLFASL